MTTIAHITHKHTHGGRITFAHIIEVRIARRQFCCLFFADHVEHESEWPTGRSKMRSRRGGCVCVVWLVFILHSTHKCWGGWRTLCDYNDDNDAHDSITTKQQQQEEKISIRQDYSRRSGGASHIKAVRTIARAQFPGSCLGLAASQ